MIASSHTVLVRPRNERVAFIASTTSLVPGSSRFDQAVDAVIGWSNGHWGGRTNPIVFVTGDTLTEEDWKIVEVADPDVVVALTPLPQKLIQALEHRINPYSFVLSDWSKEPKEQAPPLNLGGLTTPPTPQNLGRLAEGWFQAPEKLLLFEFSKDCEPLIQRFVLRNFGNYDQWFDAQTGDTRRIAWLEHLLPQIPTHVIRVSDRASLAAGLTELAGWMRPRDHRAPIRFISPMQLCSVGLRPGWGTDQDTYLVVVGDEPMAVSEHWNSVLWRSGWDAPHRRGLWLPTAFAIDPIIQEALRDWLGRYSDYGSASKSVVLLGFGVNESVLQSWREILLRPDFPVRTVVTGAHNWAERRDAALERQLQTSKSISSLRHGTQALRFSGLRARLKTRRLRFRGKPQEISMNLHLDID